LEPEKAAALVSKMSVDELVDLMQSLPDEDALEIMNKLPRDIKTQRIKKILEYEEDEAGGLMSTEYITTTEENTVEEVIENIKKFSSDYNSIHFVYVIDKENKFKGVVSLRRLLVAEKNEKIKDVMRGQDNIPVATVTQELLEVASLITKYNLTSIAVVDEQRKLLGVITVDDLMRHFVPQA